MARYVANVDILTETFETWLLRTNTLLHSLSTEILTANSTWANTGNTSVPRNAQLYGKFVANVIYVSDALSGGSNTTTTANLNITSNVTITGATVNSAANSRYTNTAFFEANVQANGAAVTIRPFSNAGSRATELTVNTDTITVRSANLIVKSNTSFTAMTVVSNDVTSNTNMFGNNLNISANLVVSSLNHTVAGNTNFDSGTLFVDGTNNRVGIKTTTPDTELTVVGSANVVGNTWLGNRLTVVGNSSITSGIMTVVTNASSANVVSIIAANVNIDSGVLFVDQVANRVGINTTTPDTSLQVVGQANVSGAVRFANTLAVIGNTTLSNTIAVTGNATLSNTLSVAGNVQFNSTGLHTIAGNVNFDSGTLFVDSTNNRVGINSTTPDASVRVVGTANVTGATWVGGNTSLTTGILTINNDTTTSANTLNITGANVNIDAGTLFVDQVANRVGVNNMTPDASLAVTGTANVSGATRLASTLTVVGSANVLSTFGVTGAANALSTFGITGAANALSTFGVTGLATLSGNVNTTVANASIAVNVGANVNITTDSITVGNTTVNTFVTSSLINTDGRLVVLGNTNLSNTLTVTGATLLSNTLNVVGAANLQSSANVGGTLGVTGATTLASTLSVTGAANTLSTLGITGAANALSTFGVTGAANALSTFGVTGLTTLAGNVNTTVANASVAVNIGANVNLTTSRVNVGNSTVNTSITATSIETDGILIVTGAANVLSTFGVAGAANALSTFGITGAANALSTFGVTGAANALSTFGVTGLTTLSGNVNTTVANASVAVNVGANVNITPVGVTIGNTTVNTTITATSIATDGTLVVTGAANALSTFGVSGLTTLLGNVNTTVANASVGINVGTNVNLAPTSITVGNTTVNTFITSAEINTDGVLAVLGNTNLSNTLTVTGATILSNTLSVVGSANLQSSANVGGTLGVTGAATFANTLRVTGQANVLSTLGITGAANALSTLGVAGATTLASTLNVTGLTTLSGNVNTPAANASVVVRVGANVVANTTSLRITSGSDNSTVTGTFIATTGTMNVGGDASFTSNVSVNGTLQTTSLSVASGPVLMGDYVIDITSNSNIGSTASPQKVYQFAKETYSSGKIMVQVKNGSITQMSEMVIAHNNTDAYITVYGTVASPPGANSFAAPLGTFTSTINSTSNAVELFLQQTLANSAVKVVAHLIK